MIACFFCLPGKSGQGWELRSGVVDETLIEGVPVNLSVNMCFTHIAFDCDEVVTFIIARGYLKCVKMIGVVDRIMCHHIEISKVDAALSIVQTTCYEICINNAGETCVAPLVSEIQGFGVDMTYSSIQADGCTLGAF